jgi:hypothetical protein
MFSRPSQHQALTQADYIVAWLTTFLIELATIIAALDACHPDLKRCQHDSNLYVLGSIDKHNVVIAFLAERDIRMNSMAFIVAQMISNFPSVGIRLMVRIGSGIL